MTLQLIEFLTHRRIYENTKYHILILQLYCLALLTIKTKYLDIKFIVMQY